MKRRAWFVYVLGGLALLAAWGTYEPLTSGPVYSLIVLTSPVAILVAVRIHRPEHRTPWYLFALGQTLFLAGNVVTYNHELLFDETLTFPSSGDAAFLAVYPCLIAGILLLIRERSPGRDREAFIDSLILAVAVGTVAWVYLLAPVTQDTASGLMDKTVGMAYPLMDLVLLATVVRLALGAGRRAASFWLMTAAAISLLFTDFSHSYLTFRGVMYDRSGALEAGWALFFLFWGAAALHGSMRTVAAKTSVDPRGLTEPRLALMASASLVAPVTYAVQAVRGETMDAQVLIGASAILFLLVVARMAGLVYAQQRSARRERALRESAGALVTATSRDSISVATMHAVRTLAGQDRAAGLLVNLDEEHPTVFSTVATSGAADGALGVEIDLRDLSKDVRERLLAGSAVEVRTETSRLAQLLETPGEATHLLALPLLSKGDLEGMLTVAGSAPTPASVRESLQTLAAEVVLALESAGLTEDLLRREGESRLSSLVQNSSDVVVIAEADSTLRYVSPSAERVLGYEPEALEGLKLTSLIHPEDRPRVLTFMTVGDREGHRRHAEALEFRLRHQDGTWLHVETLRSDLRDDPNVRGIVLNTRDISDRKAFEEQLKHQAFHDPITNLANRALFRDRVEHALERQTRDGGPISVLFVDLDDFKTVNDSLGHEVGDDLLRGVGARLRDTLRAADTSARLGGDEFAVLLDDGGDAIGAADAASRILETLEAPFHLVGKDVFIRASIGIATASPGSVTASADELMRNADVAMYMAKEDGKSRYQVFEPAMHDAALRRLELKADLQRAIDNEEFVLHYQPVIELETGEISGVEALVRWQHPDRGMVPPLDFIPIAEETGLIVPIGRWVLREACLQAVALDERFRHDPPLDMAVNLSARQLQRRELVEEVAATLAETGLDPSRLVVEITESVMMQDMDLSIQRLAELKALGVQLAVDDFGTGYSSLNYIRRFPVDILKVDKSFIDEVSAGGEETVLAAAIIEIAGILNLRPVAEGIERADQLDRLLALNCELGQGFYFAKPMPIEGIDELLTVRHALETRESELSPQAPGGASLT